MNIRLGEVIVVKTLPATEIEVTKKDGTVLPPVPATPAQYTVFPGTPATSKKPIAMYAVLAALAYLSFK